MLRIRKASKIEAPKAPVQDPRFPDYSKVTGTAYDLDAEVLRGKGSK